ncbi:ADP-ribosylglycohydrolase family protein [Nitratireductor sp. GCM10026969]|uniref:ADP-ribosylglycohydrolase family protein n=1 Tax=Nitratireductor sp. GCM10026969 TaxID=3252645 RepID=UPI0036137277
MTRIPEDYLERVYAGVLGKLIGVYLGRPIEGWSHARIMRTLGPIAYYVHERLGQPLVVTDDDVSGTFTFVRALDDHGISPELSAEEIGKTWLNFIVGGRSTLWWGGNGNSTEHTAWLNLKHGIKAPASGAIATNGKIIAEQIGAQIFIDGWALVAPGQPHLAARLAEQAARVSHDGEAVFAAKLWAAMEAAAFNTTDVDQLLETGLSVIPADSRIARLIGDVRRWRGENADWQATRQAIENHYGYDKYPGICHVVPNHALMIMAILYAPDDFARAQTIVNTSGWDTDCNAGNVGCLMGIMLGLEGLDAGPDWRGPLADRLLISSADGGNAVNDAVRVSYHLADLGVRLAGRDGIEPPKDGARFHFSLPGSVQGFRPQKGTETRVRLSNEPFAGARALAIHYKALAEGQPAAVTTPTFAPPEVGVMDIYELMATPLLSPGQHLKARLVAPASNQGTVAARLRLSVYDEDGRLRDVDCARVGLAPGSAKTLEWRVPSFDGQPIGAVGIALGANTSGVEGKVLLDYLRWDGSPDVVLRRPPGKSDFWHRAWVNAVDSFSDRFAESFRISQARGEGMIIHGTRDWTDYRVETECVLHLGDFGGVALRVQGLRRYYGVRATRENRLEIVRVRDEEVKVLASTPFDLALEKRMQVTASAVGNIIQARVDDVDIEARDESELAFRDGGIGLVIASGALSADFVAVSPP